MLAAYARRRWSWDATGSPAAAATAVAQPQQPQQQPQQASAQAQAQAHSHAQAQAQAVSPLPPLPPCPHLATAAAAATTAEGLNRFTVARLVVTPSWLLPLPPACVQGSRLLRAFWRDASSFVYASFKDEQLHAASHGLAEQRQHQQQPQQRSLG